MVPFVLNGDILTVAPVVACAIRTGDIVFYAVGEHRSIAHRVHGKRACDGQMTLLVRGDAAMDAFDVIPMGQVLGKAVCLERNGVERRLDSFCRRWTALLTVRGLRLIHFAAQIGRRSFRIFIRPT